MKGLFFALVLVCASVVQAAAPTDAAVDGNYQWNRDYTISSAVGLDTLSGDSETDTILSGFTPKQGWQYVLVVDTLSGTGKDSVKVAIQVECFDALANSLYTLPIDSITDSTGVRAVVPFGGTLFGATYNIKAASYTDNGGEVIINRAYLYKRRVKTLHLRQ